MSSIIKMKFAARTAFHLSLLTILIATAAWPGPQGTALASRQDTETVVAQPASLLDQAAVNLYCRLRQGHKLFSVTGGGAIIDPRGIILTNAHMAQFFLLSGESSRAKGTGRLRGSCDVKKGSPSKDAYTATLLYMPTAWLENQTSGIKGATGKDDFALLLITGASKGPLPERFPALPLDPSGSIAQGEAVTLRGYPAEHLSFSQINDKLRAVTASSTIEHIQGLASTTPDLLTLAPSAAGSPGISGSPVLNANGSVIGVATAKSTIKNDRTLLAVSTYYIDHAMQAQTFLPLNIFLIGDLKTKAAAANEKITPEEVKTIEDGLLRAK